MSRRRPVAEAVARAEFAEPVTGLRAPVGLVAELLLEFLDEHAPASVREEAVRFVFAKSAGKAYQPAGRSQRERARRALLGTRLALAQRIDLSGLGPRDAEDLATVVRHLEDEVASAKRKAREGRWW